MCWILKMNNYYKKTVDDAVDFISGKSRRIQKKLSKEMEIASKDLRL